jgi:hypothetical protein
LVTDPHQQHASGFTIPEDRLGLSGLSNWVLQQVMHIE